MMKTLPESLFRLSRNGPCTVISNQILSNLQKKFIASLASFHLFSSTNVVNCPVFHFKVRVAVISVEKLPIFLPALLDEFTKYENLRRKITQMLWFL